MNASLKSDTLLYGVAVMGERLLGLLLLPLLTRQLTAAEFGIWTQTLVVSSVMMPVILACLPAAIVNFFATGLTGALRRRWMFHTLVLAMAMFTVLGLVAWYWQTWVARAVYGSNAQTRFVAVLLMLLAADALFDLLVAYLRAASRIRSIALMLLVRGGGRLGFLSIALGSLGVAFGDAFAGIALLQLGWVAGVYLLVATRSRDAPRRDESGARGAESVTWRAMLDFSAPLVMISVLTSVNGFADRFVLTHVLGLHSVAVYAAVGTLVSVTHVAYSVLGFTLFPVLARHWAQGDEAGARRRASDAVSVFLFLGMPFVLWLACMTNRLMPLLTTRDYRVGGEVALLLGVAAIGFGLYQIALYLMLLSGQGARAAWLMLVAAFVNIALNMTLVPRHGLMGAAMASAVSNAVLASSAYVSVVGRVGAMFPWAGAVRTAFGACLAAAAAFVLDRWLPQGDWGGIMLSLALASVVYVVVDLLPGRSMIHFFFWRKEPV